MKKFEKLNIQCGTDETMATEDLQDLCPLMELSVST